MASQGQAHNARCEKCSGPDSNHRSTRDADETGDPEEPIRYGFRFLDRQWIIPDNRLINQPNPELWELRSDRQVYLTAFTEESPTNGPALTFTGLVPDLHHYKGSFGGRVFPLWRDKKAPLPNMPPKLLTFMSERYGMTVGAEDLVAYIAAVAAHPAFTARFQDDLSTPGIKFRFAARPKLFSEAVELGKTVIRLHTFGERMADPKKGRRGTASTPAAAKPPRIPAAGEISEEAEMMPDSINYDASKKRLLIGQGYVEKVEPEMWQYEVSGKQVLLQRSSYRKKDRERPIIGDRRPPSPLGNIQPDHWLAEYTTELLNVLNVIGRLSTSNLSKPNCLRRFAPVQPFQRGSNCARSRRA